MNDEMIIRAATVDDAPQLLDIYAYYVKKTAITFEYDVPTEAEFRSRIEHTLKQYPYLVALMDGRIVGYAYASALHERAAYAWNAEMTVYIDHVMRSLGIGRRLYSLLEEILKCQGVVRAVALITPPTSSEDNAVYNSIAFHQTMGYTFAGKIPQCGYKFGRWFDTALMYKNIGDIDREMQPILRFCDVKEKFGL